MVAKLPNQMQHTTEDIACTQQSQVLEFPRAVEVSGTICLCSWTLQPAKKNLDSCINKKVSGSQLEFSGQAGPQKISTN